MLYTYSAAYFCGTAVHGTLYILHANDITETPLYTMYKLNVHACQFGTVFKEFHQNVPPSLNTEF